MNKQDLIAKIAQDTGLTRITSEAALESVIDGIFDALVRGESVTLAGFGTFAAAARSERHKHDPRTGSAREIPAGRIVRFTPGKPLKARLKI
jgi:DNA-binding protein HU-beta